MLAEIQDIKQGGFIQDHELGKCVNFILTVCQCTMR